MWYRSVERFLDGGMDGSKCLFVVCRQIGRNEMMMMTVTCIMNGMACYQCTFSFFFPSLSAFSPNNHHPTRSHTGQFIIGKLTNP